MKKMIVTYDDPTHENEYILFKSAVKAAKQLNRPMLVNLYNLTSWPLDKDEDHTDAADKVVISSKGNAYAVGQWRDGVIPFTRLANFGWDHGGRIDNLFN